MEYSIHFLEKARLNVRLYDAELGSDNLIGSKQVDVTEFLKNCYTEYDSMVQHSTGKRINEEQPKFHLNMNHISEPGVSQGKVQMSLQMLPEVGRLSLLQIFQVQHCVTA